LTATNPWAEKLSSVTVACQSALVAMTPPAVLEKLRNPAGSQRAFDILARATALRNPETQLLDQFQAEAAIPMDDAAEIAMAQSLLLAAALHTIPQIPTLPVSDSVKQLFAEEFLFYAAPPEQWRSRLRFSEVRFREMGRIATLQRFPAGQYHWELAAFPRSWLPGIAGQWSAALPAFLRMRGFGPLFELHLNDRRKNRVMLLESEAGLSCYKAAQSLALQPGTKGIMTVSWLYCRSTATVTPHLAWMRRFFEQAGATIVDVRDAPSDAGFLVGSAERRKLYEEGSYRPKESCVLWPRQQVLQWMKQHPELDR
jgi:hypothetical protein